VGNIFGQQFPYVMLVMSATHTHAFACNPRKPQAIVQRRALRKATCHGCAPPAKRCSLPRQRGGGGARVHHHRREPRRSAPPSTHGELKWVSSIMFNKSLVAVYTSALRPDLLKIQKNTYIKTTCFWHELRDPRPCYPARLLDGASLMCMSSSVMHYAIPHS
jgi:hypothetical protein